MSDIITAIGNIADLNKSKILRYDFNEDLSHFIDDAFTNTLSVENTFKNLKYKVEESSNIFSYAGTSRTPPDRIIKNGDAIIVKSLDDISDKIIFQKTHPENKLTQLSLSLNKYSRKCENWEEKDIIYTIANRVNNKRRLSSIWFIYGSIYLANKHFYLSIKNTITNIDPLDNTSIIIPKKWSVKSPVEVFDYVYSYKQKSLFQLIAIIPSDKYYSFPLESREKIEKSESIDLEIKDVKVKNPNNPVALIPCKLITYQIPQS